jgi:hypothetical protein
MLRNFGLHRHPVGAGFFALCFFPAHHVRALRALALVTLAGCGSEDCISMECGPPNVEIQFEPSISQAGHYRFDLEVDGMPSTCEFDFLPDGGRSGASACGSLLLRGGVSRDLATEVVGYALPQATRVTIAAFRDGQPWAEHSFEPVYRGVELRGEGCGDCVVATEVVALP